LVAQRYCSANSPTKCMMVIWKNLVWLIPMDGVTDTFYRSMRPWNVAHEIHKYVVAVNKCFDYSVPVRPYGTVHV